MNGVVRQMDTKFSGKKGRKIVAFYIKKQKYVELSYGMINLKQGL